MTLTCWFFCNTISNLPNTTVYITSSNLTDFGILQSSLDPSLSESLFFIHSLSGCDTTSRPYGIGKMYAIGQYRDLQEVAHVFMMSENSWDALAVLYACKFSTDLNLEQASKFSEKVASSSSYVAPERLGQHIVGYWLGIGHPQNQTRNFLSPKRMKQVSAPVSLLKIVRCNCSGNCGKNTCSCKRNGLQCTLACGQCKGITCTNGPCPDDDDDVSGCDD